MDQKTIAKLRRWMQQYGAGGTVVAACYLMLCSLRKQRRAMLLLSTVGLASICALLLLSPPHQRTRTSAVPTLPMPAPSGMTAPVIDLDKSLLDAVREKDLPRVKTALAAGANVDAVDQKGYSALMLAVEANQEKIARLLLQHDADIEHTADSTAQSTGEETALSIAVGNKNVPIVRLLLEHKSPERSQDEGNLPADLLGQACADGSNAIVRLLVAHGAQVGASWINGLNPLSVAADCHHAETIDLLLSLGAELDQENAREGSALFWVADKGDLSMVKFLVERGADVNYRSQHESVLQSAVQHPEIVRYLLKHGAKVDILAKGEMTPLAEAACEGNVESVRILLAHGADGNHLSGRGGTALNQAAYSGHINVVKTLLRWGVDVDLRAIDPETKEPFETALQTAKAYHHPDIARLLERAGARE